MIGSRFPLGLAASVLLASALLSGSAEMRARPRATCNPQAVGIKHVVHIQFDNVHLRRDNPTVPSDLEQMPNLLNFLRDNGVISGNHHTPLISHTADDIITTLTGVYGARHGQPVSNSYGYFRPDGSVGFQQFVRILDGYRAGRRAANDRPARQGASGAVGALHARRL